MQPWCVHAMGRGENLHKIYGIPFSLRKHSFSVLYQQQNISSSFFL